MGKDTKEYARIANEIFDVLRYYDVPLGTTKNKKKWGTGDFFNAIDRLADIRRMKETLEEWKEIGKRHFEYENLFYHTSNPQRLAKIMAHYELYKKVLLVPGAIIELGVFKGASLIRLATFNKIYDNESKKVVGFDTYGIYPETKYEQDKKLRQTFIRSAGRMSIKKKALQKIFEEKGIGNVELVKGDINMTVPAYVKAHPELKISLLHLDADIYEPTKTAIEQLYPHISRGGIIILDDYGTFAGETKATDEYFEVLKLKVRKLRCMNTPAYIIKE